MSNIKPIPGFSRYGITEGGTLYNLKTGTELKTTPDIRGYHLTTLVNDQGKRRGVKRHRLVALTYLEAPPGELGHFVVNHKNLVPGDDRKDNLEWVTQQRNVEHWVEQGGKRVSTPLEVIDAQDNERRRYNSVAECSKDLGIERYCIQIRLSRGPQYVWPEGFRYRLGHSDDPWPAVEKLKYGRGREVILRCLRTGELIIFTKLNDALSLTGYKLGAMWKWATDPTQPVIPRLYQIQFLNDLKPWREVPDLLEGLQEGLRSKVVVTFDNNWENPMWYESARACADLNQVKPTALNHRLKSKGSKVFADGKRYCYYDDLDPIRKQTIRYEVPPEGCVQRPSKATVVDIDDVMTPV